MECAAAGVDIAAVGGDVEEGDGASWPTLRRWKSSGATAAAAPLAQSATMRDRRARGRGQSRGGTGCNRTGRRRCLRPAEAWLDRGRRFGGVVKDFVFHGELERVGEFEAVAAEELDAVILPGIVGGGDDDAGLKAVGAGEKGDGGGGDDAGALDACSRRRGGRRRG